MRFLLLSLVVCLCSGRPQIGFQSAQNTQFQNIPQFNPNQFQSSDPIEDLSQGVHGLANGARATAVLVEQGGGVGLDIYTQFGQLFGRFSYAFLLFK